jgi:hypothetical protein
MPFGLTLFRIGFEYFLVRDRTDHPKLLPAQGKVIKGYSTSGLDSLTHPISTYINNHLFHNCDGHSKNMQISINNFCRAANKQPQFV